MPLSQHMQALTLVEYSLGTIDRSYASKHLPLDRITDEQLEQIECLATRDYRSQQAVAYATEVLAGTKQPQEATA